MRLIRASDYQRKRWKNDGGWTTEISSEPPENAANGFRWRLLAGPTRDFNVMTARGQVSAEVHARPLTGTMLVFAEPRCTWLIHVFAGQALVRSDSQSMTVECGETLVVDAPINQRERFVIEGSGELVLVKLTNLD